MVRERTQYVHYFFFLYLGRGLSLAASFGCDPDADRLKKFPAWVSYLNMSVLIGTLAVALFNASKDPVARNFAYLYAVISVGILVRIHRPFSLIAKFFVPLLYGAFHPFIRSSSYPVDIWVCAVPATYHHDPQT